MTTRLLLTALMVFVATACNDNRNYMDLPATSTNGEVVGVIEIAAGTNTVVEYNALTNDFGIDSANSPIGGLAAPANFGFVPSTNHNGDRVDAMILGEALPQGSIVEMRILGAIETSDSASRLVVVCSSIKEEYKTVDAQNLDDLLAKYNEDVAYAQTWLLRLPDYQGKTVRRLNREEAQSLFEKTVLRKSEDY